MKTVLSPFAKIDLSEAKNYYKNIRPGLAKDFLNVKKMLLVILLQKIP